MTVITLQVPAKINEPRGSVVAARWFTALLNALEGASARRTSRRLAADRQTDAAAVRSYAQSLAAQDPRFAADLCAAADRHERE